MRLSNNITLPTLPMIAARSTWAIVFAALITLFNALGIDLLGFFRSIGAGSTPDEVLATGQKVVSAWQIVAPLMLGIWAWVERRAPSFRLTMWGSKAASSSLGIFVAVVALGLMTIAPNIVQAQTSSSCFDPAELKVTLAERFGEELIGWGALTSEKATGIFANPSSGSWTLVVFTDGKACVLLSGEQWTATTRAPPGAPA